MKHCSPSTSLVISTLEVCDSVSSRGATPFGRGVPLFEFDHDQPREGQQTFPQIRSLCKFFIFLDHTELRRYVSLLHLYTAQMLVSCTICYLVVYCYHQFVVQMNLQLTQLFCHLVGT